MLDSLVRVSRRVRWGANQFATNPEHHLGSNLVLDDKQSRCTVNSPSKSNMPRRPGTQALGQVRHRSSASQLANTFPVCNTPIKERSYLPGRLKTARKLVVALSLWKVHWLTAGSTGNLSRGSEYTHVLLNSQLNSTGRLCGPICLPLNGFTYSLTLSSKYFSTFPHGTCMLSVSHQYLALDGVYHPLWAAFPNNPTPRTLQGMAVSTIEAYHPLWERPQSGGLGH